MLTTTLLCFVVSDGDMIKVRCGLWRDPQPVPPWEWRHAAKAGRAPVAAGSQTCHVGPRGGRYTITADGRKQYGCSSPQ